MRRHVLPAALCALALAGGTSAAAPPPEEVAFGYAANTGRMSPGVPATGCAAQTSVEFTIFGSVYTNGGSRPPSPFGATFTGASAVCASLASDTGAGTFSGGFNGSVSYIRSGHVVSISGTVSVVGYGTRAVTGHCWWGGTYAPGTTFTPVCGLLLDA